MQILQHHNACRRRLGRAADGTDRLEEAAPHLSNFVLIGAPARIGNEVMGSLAVLGPTRIDYEHTITAVSYIARLFDSILNGPEESKRT